MEGEARTSQQDVSDVGWCIQRGVRRLMSQRNKDRASAQLLTEGRSKHMSTTYDVVQTLDLKGLPCPIPVVRVGKAIKSIDVGEILEALATDPGVMMDIPAWCKSTGHEMVELARFENVFRFVLRRAH